MKTKDQKYREAVLRNLENFERIGNRVKFLQLQKLGIKMCRGYFGIRENDSIHDKRIKEILKRKTSRKESSNEIS